MSPHDCPFCNHPNPEGAKFCNACGSPLHLTPCGDCGAVNNLAETHCWRCGALLLPLDPLDALVPADRFERELAVPERAPAEPDLEEELEALEQEVQALEQAPRSAEGARMVAPPPREPSAPFATPPPRYDIGAAPRRPRRRIVATAVVAALASTIALGAYLYDRVYDRDQPARRAPASSSAPLPVTPSPEPRVVREVATAAAALPTPVAEPGPTRTDAPDEPRVAGDAGGAPAVPPPAAEPAPACPPAVAALALCEWLVRQDRQ